MSPHDATARARLDPLLFLDDIYDHVDDAYPFDAPYDASPQCIVFQAMGRVARADLADAGITANTPRLGWMLR